MTRFIVVSFLVMGWAYYELSGGSDFVPEVRPEAQLANARLSTSSEPPAIEAEPEAEVITAVSEPAVQPVLTPEQDVAEAVAEALAQPEETLADDLPATQVAEADLALPEEEADDELTFVSLSQSPDGQGQEAVSALAEDLRIVDASRLNVRLGPSTGDSVVGQLLRGEVVTLVATNGNGWAQVRVEGDGVEGWVAERFLTR